MNIRWLSFFILSCVATSGYCQEEIDPDGLIQEVWKSNLSRSYTSGFEVYRSDFDPQKNPEVKVYIAIR